MSATANTNIHEKSEHQHNVESFMLRAGQSVPVVPTEPDEKTRILRAKLILEEALETIRDGLGVDVYCRSGYEIQFEHLTFGIARPFNMRETADGCADIRVVTTGTLSACGLPDGQLTRLVDRNNLEKFGPGHSIRDDGKLVKPAGHKPPDIARLLAELGWGDTVAGNND